MSGGGWDGFRGRIGLRRRLWRPKNALAQQEWTYLTDVLGRSRYRVVLSYLAMPKTSFSAALSPDQLKQLAEIEVAQARRIKSSDERLRRLTFADALTNLAEIKRLMPQYERRFLN